MRKEIIFSRKTQFTQIINRFALNLFSVTLTSTLGQKKFQERKPIFLDQGRKVNFDVFGFPPGVNEMVDFSITRSDLVKVNVVTDLVIMKTS